MYRNMIYGSMNDVSKIEAFLGVVVWSKLIADAPRRVATTKQVPATFLLKSYKFNSISRSGKTPTSNYYILNSPTFQTDDRAYLSR